MSNKLFLARLSIKIAALWERLTRPAPEILAASEQLQVRLLAGLLFLLSVLTVLGIFIPFVFDWQRPDGFVEYLLLVLLSSVGLYFLALSRRHRIARSLTFVMLCSIPFMALFTYDDFSSTNLRLVLPWFLIAFELGAALLSLQKLSILVGVNLLLVLVLISFYPQSDLQGVAAAAGFLLSMVGLIYVSKISRDKLETKRQAELLDMNKRLQALSSQLEQTISERTLALSNLEGQYRALVENNPLSVMRFDHRYHCLYANPVAAGHVGVPVAEMIGKSLRALRGGNTSIKMLESQIDMVFRASQPVEAEISLGNQILNWWFSPEFDSSGRVISVAATALDVTERRRNEEALRTSETRFRVMNDASPFGVFVDDPDGNCIYYNAVYLELTGLSAEDIAARRWNDIVHPDDRARVAEMRERALKEPPYHFENVHRYKRRDGRVIWVNVKIVAMWEGDQMIGHLGLMEDITARIEEINIRIASEEALRQRTEDLETAVKDLESFSYTVSHDLRAPLRAIDGYSRLLQHELNTTASEDATTYMNSIRDNAQKMGHLIDDLLAFSRLGRAPLGAARVDMGMLVHRVVESLRPDYENRELLIQVHELPPCRGDEALLQQVWINLISNAIKFTRKTTKAHIEVGCKVEDNGDAIYFVRDNGAGFDMAFADKLFGVFQRLHHAGEFEGTGVGLAIVQRIIRKHGGRVWARAAIGAGATFFFVVPGSQEDLG